MLRVISNSGSDHPAAGKHRAFAVERGATVIGIHRARIAAGRAVRIVIGLEPLEDTDIYTPMASRIAHLTPIDVLATGVIPGPRPSGFQEEPQPHQAEPARHARERRRDLTAGFPCRPAPMRWPASAPRSRASGMPGAADAATNSRAARKGDRVYLGIDLGTSGVKAVLLDGGDR